MRLPCLVRHFLYRRGWRQETYDDMLQTPVGKLLTCQIALALHDRASCLTLGFPPGVKVTPQLKVEISTDEQQHQEQWRREFPMLDAISQNGEAGRTDTEMELVRFCHRSALDNVPSWVNIDGQWHRMWGTPSHLFPYVVAQIGDRVVSLNASKQNPQPVKWIEYSMGHGTTGDRHFVEVKLFVEDNSSVTIEFLGTRTEPHDVRVSRYSNA